MPSWWKSPMCCPWPWYDNIRLWHTLLGSLLQDDLENMRSRNSSRKQQSSMTAAHLTEPLHATGPPSRSQSKTLGQKLHRTISRVESRSKDKEVVTGEDSQDAGTIDSPFSRRLAGARSFSGMDYVCLLPSHTIQHCLFRCCSELLWLNSDTKCLRHLWKYLYFMW